MKGMMSVQKPAGPARLKAKPSGLAGGGKKVVGGSPLKAKGVK